MPLHQDQQDRDGNLTDEEYWAAYDAAEAAGAEPCKAEDDDA